MQGQQLENVLVVLRDAEQGAGGERVVGDGGLLPLEDAAGQVEQGLQVLQLGVQSGLGGLLSGGGSVRCESGWGVGVQAEEVIRSKIRQYTRNCGGG